MSEQQEIETLINEEALLIATYLRNEKKHELPEFFFSSARQNAWASTLFLTSAILFFKSVTFFSLSFPSAL